MPKDGHISDGGSLRGPKHPSGQFTHKNAVHCLPLLGQMSLRMREDNAHAWAHPDAFSLIFRLSMV